MNMAKQSTCFHPETRPDTSVMGAMTWRKHVGRSMLTHYRVPQKVASSSYVFAVFAATACNFNAKFYTHFSHLIRSHRACCHILL